jgi:acyl transferase domain-containing protein/thioesterase domain-containing protein
MTQDFSSDIAVVGMAGRFAGARNLTEYWDNLRGGVESIRRLSDEELLAAGVSRAELSHPDYVKAGAPLPDMRCFDGTFFGFTPRESSIMDPQHRHFLECCWLALEDAAHMPESFDGAIGVYAGSGHNAYMPYNLLTNPQLVQSVGLFLLRHTGNDKDFMTTRASYLLNLKGPSVNVQTACSTSLVAIHTGCQALLNGECDMVLAGGATIDLPHGRGYKYEEGEILSPDGHCRAFDADSKGTVFGSGIGVVVLRRLADAIADGDHIHAVIKGSAINNDGSGKVGYLAPSVDGQAQSISEALAIANLGAETISYIETHGTGTPVGDPIEVAALTQVFREHTDAQQFCGIGSVKTNIGHTDTAAGVASFIKVALALQHQELPPTLHFQKGNPACEFETSPFYVNAALTPWTPPPNTPRRAGVSSLGVGGTNAHVILEEAPARKASAPPARPYQLLHVSAKTATALDGTANALAAHLQRHAELNLADVAHTLRVGRRSMPHQRWIVARDVVDAAAVLAGGDALRSATVDNKTTSAEERKVAFMFAGGGAQHPGMGADLYASEPVFQRAVDEAVAIVKAHEGIDLMPLLLPPAGTEKEAAAQLEKPSLALPALLTVQRAQALLWQSWGVSPSACIGHSMGEYTAAHLAGVFSLEDALRLVALRGRLFETLPEGAMLSVPLPASELEALLSEELSIAAVNGTQLTVAAGPVAAIEQLSRLLQEREIQATRVRIKVAAHSAMLEPILAEFGAFLRTVKMNPPKLAFVSNLSGTWITAAEATTPDYWVRHLRQTVRFAEGLRTLVQDPATLLLEIGPGRTMASLARVHPERKPAQAVFNSMRHPDEAVSDQAFMLLALGKLAASGLTVDWQQLEGNAKRQRLSLPGYAFERVEHWVEPGVAQAAQDSEPALERQADVADWFYKPTWREASPKFSALANEAATAQHVLILADAAGLGEALMQTLQAQGAQVTLVQEGPGFAATGPNRYTVAPDQSDDHAALFAALSQAGRMPQRIVHALAVHGAGAPMPLTQIERRGLFSLMALAQALGSEDLSAPITLTVLTQGAQRVADEALVQPAAALLHGAARVIGQELPQVQAHTIDVQWPLPHARQQRALLQGLAADSAAVHAGGLPLAYRGATRWVQWHDKASFSQAPLAFKRQGVYLLTGGFGGIGAAIAQHLARSFQARLVLVGRAALPARAQWPALLQSQELSAATVQRIRLVQALEAAGAQVLPQAADVTEPAALRRVLAETQKQFGALDGVLHTAGVLDDSPVQLKDENAVRAVLAPKVQGTLALGAALDAVADKPAMRPTFVALFSSISAFAGLAGQFDYAAANAFLDAYAQHRANDAHTHTVAIGWGQWQDVGMAAVLARRLGVSELDMESLLAQSQQNKTHPLIERQAGDYQGHLATEATLRIDSHWLLDEHRVRGGEALIPGTGYLELMRAALPAQAGQTLELRDVTFLSPFVVHAHEARSLRLRGVSQDSGAVDLTVLGRVRDGDGNAPAHTPWTEHVRAQAHWIHAATPAALPLAHIQARCATRSQTFDQPPQPVHLLFGPRWNCLKRIDFGTAEALIELALPEAFRGDLDTHGLHPALMDWATAGAQALVPDYDEQHCFYVPAAYGSLRWHAPLPAQVTSHVRLRGEDTQAGEMAVFDVTVCDRQGRVLVEIERFTMLRLRDKALFADAPATPHAAAPAQAVGNATLGVGAREGIRTAEGIEAMLRVLGQDAAVCVAVSPLPLQPLLRSMRRPAVPSAGAVNSAAVQAGEDAPRNNVERLVADVWSEVLGVSGIGRHGHFFELGGHSLLAVQVINKLKKRSGKPLALTALVEAPTVAELAELIDPDAAAQEDSGHAATATAAPDASHKASSSATSAPRPKLPSEPDQANRGLVTLRKGSGQRPHLFFVHDGLGETLLYRTLALRLDEGATVFGLQPAQRANGSYIHTDIRNMASAHLRQVRAAQPEGPYHLAGLCAGGVIAMEMAQQLQRDGQTVAFVGILDAADVKAAEKPLLGLTSRVAHWRDSLGHMPLHSLPGVFGRKALNYVRYKFEDRARRQADAQRVAAMAGTAAVDDTPMAFLPLYEVAHRQHEPAGRLSGTIVSLYRAQKGDGSLSDKAYREIYVGDTFGWDKRVDGSIRAVDVPGGHTSLLQEPHVQALVHELQTDLYRVWAA